MPVLKYGLYHHTLTYKGHVRTYAASAVLCMLSMYAKEMEGEEKERGRGRKGEGGGREGGRERDGTRMYACGMLIEAVICCTCLYILKKPSKAPS